MCEEVRKSFGDDVGMDECTLVGNTIGASVGTVVVSSVGVLVGGLVSIGALAGAKAGEGFLYLHFCIVLCGGPAFVHFFSHLFFFSL